MTEKGCDNCYYSYFDERAYPCSLCIRGIERTDQWQPSKKTKADRKTEPQTYITEDRDTQILDAWQVKLKAEQTEPQTDCSWK